MLSPALSSIRASLLSSTCSDFFVDTFARPLGPVSQFLKSSFQPVLIIADKRLTEHILTDKAWDRGDLLEGVFGGLAPLGMLALKTGESEQARQAGRK